MATPEIASGSHPKTTIQITNAIAELSKVVAFVDRYCAERGISSGVANDVNLCLDEILNNTISYGYGDRAPHSIAVSLSIESGAMVAEVEDDATPFDPRRAASPELAPDLRQRKVGGLGLHFVRTLMDDVGYVWDGRHNRLKLTKKLQSPRGEGGVGRSGEEDGNR